MEFEDPKDFLTCEVCAVIEIEAKLYIDRLEAMPKDEACTLVLYILSNYVYNNIDEDKRKEMIDAMTNSCQASFDQWDREDSHD